MRMMFKFQESISMDTVRNEYMLRPDLYGLMYSESSRADLEKFNDTVYAKLFLTPGSDPWLGLLSPDIYVAVDNGGAVKGR